MDTNSRTDAFRALQARPPMISQYSNSVPSTPHQMPRDLSHRSRSPSPHGPLGSHSPRSVVSETNGVPNSRIPACRPSLPCRHEKPLPGRKRRIPYGTGEEPLDKVTPEPKATLEQEEEEKLGKDMDRLYKQLLPSTESDQGRQELVKKLEKILNDEWPGRFFKVHMFGSSGNKLCTSDSDVDMCIQTDFKQLETVHDLAEALYKRRMANVICVAGAKIPIVKFEDPELKLKCDLNVNTLPSLANTRMIRTYVEIDDRVRPLAMIVKHWTKQRGLNEALNGVLNTYTWVCLIINFLQTRQPPILPALHEMKENRSEGSEFADDLEKLRGWGNENKETLPQLLFAFFRWYAHEVDYEKSVISVRTGRLMTREERGWDLKSLVPESRQRLCVEEPFNRKNIGHTADNESFRGIHQEFRRSFTALAEGASLDKCCEIYVEEAPSLSLGDSGIFQKPSAAPKPVLTSATAHSPRTGRAGPNHRNGRGNNNQRSNGSSRRNSSGTYGNGRFGQMPSPNLLAGGGTGAHIHELLLQRYIQLDLERARMENILGQTQHQGRHMGSTSAYATPSQTPSIGSPQFLNGQSSPRMPEGGLVANGNFIYAYPPHHEQLYRQQQAALAASQEGFRTNPNSPTLAIRSPALGRDQRVTVNGVVPNGSIRSQSQPARAASVQLPHAYSAYLLQEPLPNGRPSMSVSQELPQVPQGYMNGVDLPLRHSRGYAVTNGDYGPPREYLGYSIGESPRLDAQPNDLSIPNPAFLTENRRPSRNSPDLQPPRANYFGYPSRSPSPLRHARSYSAIPQYGAVPHHGSGSLRGSSRFDSIQNPAENGLLISGAPSMQHMSPPHDFVNGSDAASVASYSTLGTKSNAPHLGALTDEPESWSVSEASDQGSGKSWDNVAPAKPVIAYGSGTGAHSGLGDDDWISIERRERQPPVMLNPAPQSRAASREEPQRLAKESPKSYNHVNGNVAQPGLHIWSPPNGTDYADKAPLLSPVEEARTPSPTASRRIPHSKHASVNNANGHGGHSHHKNAKSKPSKENLSASHKQTPVPPTPINTNHSSNGGERHGKKGNTTPASATSQPNGWQQQVSKNRSRKRAKSNASSKPSAEHRKEMMPLDENERKGG